MSRKRIRAHRIRLKHRQLARELERRRLSQNHWARKLGIGRGHLSMLLSGQRPYPSPATRRKLLEGLEVPFSKLFEIEDERRADPDTVPTRLAPAPLPAGTAAGESWMNDLMQDLRYGARLLLQRPLLSLTIIAMLAMGIGANTAMFSWIDGLLLRPVRVAEPDRLVGLQAVTRSGFRSAHSYPNFLDERRLAESFDALFAMRTAPVSVSTGRGNRRAQARLASASMFDVAGIPPAVGRVYGPAEDDVPGRDAVAVLSHGFWQQQFAGAPDIVGREFQLNGQPFTVVGVMPSDFHMTVIDQQIDLWVPLAMQEVVRPGSDTLESRGASFLQVLGRLAPGVGREQAQREMDAIAAQLAEAHPEVNDGRSLQVVSGAEAVMPYRGAIAGLSGVLMAVVAAVLLIACANVAGLMLARAARRRREIGVRLALGAGRSRLVRQLLTESLLLAVVAGAAGVGVALWINRAILSLQPALPVPIHADIPLDGRVLAFSLAVSLATGVLFGLLPAWRASRQSVVCTLQGAQGRGSSAQRGRSTLVAVQIALSLSLLVGAGLFLRSLQNASRIDPGFEPDGVLLVSLDPALQGYAVDEVRDFYRRLLDRVDGLPGSESVALAEMLPMSLGTQQWGASIEGYEPAPDERMNLDYNYVSPGYLKTLGLGLVAGRDFTWQDTLDATGALLINETMARRFWPDRSPLGARVRTGGMDREVVGVVADAKYYSLGEEPLSYMYFPYMQSNQSALTLHVRVDGTPLALADAVRNEVRRLDPEIPLFDLRTLEEQMGLALLPARLSAWLLGIFGGFALLLAAVGLYGVIAYAVAQRGREIGIRMALGAAGGDVVRMVLRQAGRLGLLGGAVGLLASLLLARLASGLLYGVGALDPLAFGSAAVLILGVVIVAAWVPARRATRVDPVETLRAE